MKLMILALSLLVLVPGCCWSRRIPRCNTCNTRTPSKPLDYSYDDTQYNNEIIL